MRSFMSLCRHATFKSALSIPMVCNFKSLSTKSTKEKPFHNILYELTVKEEWEEGLRDFLPEKPVVPFGWTVHHAVGSNCFELNKIINIRSCGEECMRVFALMQVKDPELTYDENSGERREEDYINFTLFMKKMRYDKIGLEFGLTSIDSELVLDTFAIHADEDSYECAIKPFLSCFHEQESNIPTSKNCKEVKQLTNVQARRKVSETYRGPMLNELDEDLSDEILDYLEERGVNNAFAEYVMAQAYYFEQEEYLNWLRLLRRFAKEAEHMLHSE